MKGSNTHCPQNSAKTVLGKEWDPRIEFPWELHGKGSRETEGTRMISHFFLQQEKWAFPGIVDFIQFQTMQNCRVNTLQRNIQKRLFSLSRIILGH